MGTTTEISETTLIVERQILIGRDRLDNLRLVLLTLITEEGHRLIPRQHRTADRQIGLGQLFHLSLDRLQIFRCKGAFVREIVVETVLDAGTDSHLRFGVELLHRLGHQMRRRVANNLQTIGVPVRDDRQLGILTHHIGGIDQFAIDAAGQCGLGQAGAD